MHTDDRPVHHRAPLALVLRSPDRGRRSRAGGECRDRARLVVERALLRRAVRNRILQGMTGSRLHPLMRPGADRRDRGHQHRCTSRHDPPEHEPPLPLRLDTIQITQRRRTCLLAIHAGLATLRAVEDYTNKYKVRVSMRVAG